MQWNAISFISASKAEKNITVEDKKKNEYSHFINTYTKYSIKGKMDSL